MSGGAADGTRIVAIRLLCRDPARIAGFYEAAFESGLVDASAMLIGQQRVALARATAAERTPGPANATDFQHFAIVVADMAAAMRRLDAVPGWSAISRGGPQRLPAGSGGVTAFKFRDPEGHPLELLAFPADAIPPRWRGRTGLCLGIDHTAITVADTERSVTFYERLGFTVASRGLNEGPEQERLDGLDDPVVEVTALSPPGGGPPHLELLRYREPATLARPAADGDPLATSIVLSGPAPARLAADPDGHRLAWADAETATDRSTAPWEG